MLSKARIFGKQACWRAMKKIRQTVDNPDKTTLYEIDQTIIIMKTSVDDMLDVYDEE